MNGHTMWSRGLTQWRRHKTFYGNGGLEGCAYGTEQPNGSPTIFVKKTKKLTCGQTRARRGVQKNGWTPSAFRGQKLPVSVDSGTGAVTSIVLMAFSEPHGWFTFH